MQKGLHPKETVKKSVWTYTQASFLFNTQAPPPVHLKNKQYLATPMLTKTNGNFTKLLQSLQSRSPQAFQACWFRFHKHSLNQSFVIHNCFQGPSKQALFPLCIFIKYQYNVPRCKVLSCFNTFLSFLEVWEIFSYPTLPK